MRHRMGSWTAGTGTCVGRAWRSSALHMLLVADRDRRTRVATTAEAPAFGVLR